LGITARTGKNLARNSLSHSTQMLGESPHSPPWPASRAS